MMVGGSKVRRIGARWALCLPCVWLAFAGACAGDDAEGDAGAPGGPLRFTDALSEGETVPPRHKCPMAVVTGGIGDNLSPPLSWSGVPAGTRSFALVLHDIRYDFFHWALWDLSPELDALPEGLSAGFDVPELPGAHQLGSGDDPHAYYGPCSDAGPFAGTYAYRLYALDVDTLGLADDVAPADLQAAIDAAMLESVGWEAIPE